MDAMTKEMRTKGVHQTTKHPGKRSDPSPTPQNLTTKKLLIYSGERLYSPPQTGNSHIHGPFLKKGLPLGNLKNGLNFFYFAAEGKNFGAQGNRHCGQNIQTSEGAWGSAGLYRPEVMDRCRMKDEGGPAPGAQMEFPEKVTKCLHWSGCNYT